MQLYLHIPFCIRKCLYCDFLSFPAERGMRERYVRALKLELAARAHLARGREISSVFFGGGTPSLLAGEELAELMDAIRGEYALAGDAEITAECNPGTADAGKLRAYREAGVNRLSIGLQSADDAELARLGRIHTFARFREIWEDAAEAGFANLNLDLISAVPGQTMESWERTLRTVLLLDPLPTHLSAYSLIVEEGTEFARMQEAGELELPDEDAERAMYRRTAELLAEHGFARYEISNYARPGYACRHNLGYWTGAPYLGFGLGAASYFPEGTGAEGESPDGTPQEACSGRARRISNTRSLQAYLADPARAEDPGTEELLSERDRMAEYCILGLRLALGISETEFAGRFGKPLRAVYGEVLQKNIRDGLIRSGRAEADPGQADAARLDAGCPGAGEPSGDVRYALTGRGLDLANYVMAQFLPD